MHSTALFFRLTAVFVVTLLTMFAVSLMGRALANHQFKSGDRITVAMWCEASKWPEVEGRVREAMAEPGIALWQAIVNDGIGCYDSRAYGHPYVGAIFLKFRPDIPNMIIDIGKRSDCVIEGRGSEKEDSPHIITWGSKHCPPEA